MGNQYSNLPFAAMRHNVKSLLSHWELQGVKGQSLSLTIEHYLHACNQLLEGKYEIMARKKSNKGNDNFGGVKFCTISLDTIGKEKMRVWSEENAKNTEKYGVELLTNGWKTSMSFDAENDCFIAASTQQYDDDENYKICVTSRSENPFTSLILNYYKILVLYKNKALPTERPDNKWG